MDKRNCLSALLLALLCWVALTAGAAASAPASFDPDAAFVYVPPSVREGSRPVRVLFALHGMGGEGRGFCQSYRTAADQNGWIVVAPTFGYGDWKDPAMVVEDDLALTRQMVDMLDSMPERIGRPVEPKAIVVGFSRGAQLAHRFAEIYPDRTSAAVVMSAGSYTVPSVADSQGVPLPFPFGEADLSKLSGRSVAPAALGAVPFWVSVGGSDANPNDVPRQWDAIEGTTRLQRAASFVKWLTDAGVPAQLTVFPGAGHEMNGAMVRAAVDYLSKTVAPPAATIDVLPEPAAV